jgi:hypothetical protein
MNIIAPCDEHARLIGEHVYVDLSSIRIEEGDPADIVTPERAAKAGHAAARTGSVKHQFGEG